MDKRVRNQAPDISSWADPEALKTIRGFEEHYKEVRRNRQVMKGRRYNRFREHDKIPSTPFEALRLKLELNTQMWADLIEVDKNTVWFYENGKALPSPMVAKRMIEEARIRGVAVTLDELYQHVVAHRRVYPEDEANN